MKSIQKQNLYVFDYTHMSEKYQFKILECMYKYWHNNDDKGADQQRDQIVAVGETLKSFHTCMRILLGISEDGYHCNQEHVKYGVHQDGNSQRQHVVFYLFRNTGFSVIITHDKLEQDMSRQESTEYAVTAAGNRKFKVLHKRKPDGDHYTDNDCISPAENFTVSEGRQTEENVFQYLFHEGSGQKSGQKTGEERIHAEKETDQAENC